MYVSLKSCSLTTVAHTVGNSCYCCEQSILQDAFLFFLHRPAKRLAFARRVRSRVNARRNRCLTLGMSSQSYDLIDSKIINRVDVVLSIGQRFIHLNQLQIEDKMP